MKKFKIELAKYKVTLANGVSYEARIGAFGNQVFTDEFGNRYLPCTDNEGGNYADLLELMFKPASYLVVSPFGYSVELENLEKM